MCVSEGNASMPMTCRTSSNCPPSAWLKCLRACLKDIHFDLVTPTMICLTINSGNSEKLGMEVMSNHEDLALKKKSISYLTASIRLFCLMSSINSWILKLNSKQLWKQGHISTKLNKLTFKLHRFQAMTKRKMKCKPMKTQTTRNITTMWLHNYS